MSNPILRILLFYNELITIIVIQKKNYYANIIKKK